MIDELLPELFNLKLQALSTAATRIFRSLHHKDQVARIEIQGDGRATLFSHEGTEITLPKSSGESQLFVLSLVGALAEVTGYKVPPTIIQAIDSFEFFKNQHLQTPVGQPSPLPHPSQIETPGLIHLKHMCCIFSIDATVLICMSLHRYSEPSVEIKCQTFHTDFLTDLTEWTTYAGTTALPAPTGAN